MIHHTECGFCGIFGSCSRFEVEGGWYSVCHGCYLLRVDAGLIKTSRLSRGVEEE